MDGKKTVLVTGAARGIGKAIASIFVVEGYNVVINTRQSRDELQRTYKELSVYSDNVLALVGDMSDYKTAREAVAEAVGRFGSIDVLVNNAGVSYVGLFNTMSHSQWQDIINNNLNSVINCSHAALQYMVREQSGNIINISSMWGSLGASCEVIYSATKGAVNSFTKALAKEVAPSNIRVNAIACGAIDTQMNSFLSAEERAALEEEIPLGRYGTADEVAEMALFLAEDKSRYITGQIIGVDGGMT